MALTHRIIRRIELPHESGEWIEVRAPSLAILDRAKEARLRRVLKTVEGIDFSQIKTERQERSEQSGPDYDWQALLTDCIVAWSYPEPVKPENVAELDEQTVDVIVADLLGKGDESDRKNGSGGSTMPSKVTALCQPSG